MYFQQYEAGSARLQAGMIHALSRPSRRTSAAAPNREMDSAQGVQLFSAHLVRLPKTFRQDGYTLIDEVLESWGVK
jgi:hypothetical protein